MVSDIEMQRYRNKKIRICDKNSIPYFDKTKQKVVRRKGFAKNMVLALSTIQICIILLVLLTVDSIE